MKHVRIVLVRPRNPGNIGASARALANFGFSELVLLDPHPPLLDEARAAPEAESVLLKARVVTSWKDAVSGCDQVLGTSSFHQRQQAQAKIPLPELCEWLARHPRTKKWAIVFGSERSGLSNEELTQCDAVIQIPTTADTPSMNLAQAVAVTLYGLSQSLQTKPQISKEVFADSKTLIEESIQLAKKFEYPAGYPDAKRAGRFREGLSGLRLTAAQDKLLVSFLRWIKRKS